MQWSSDSSVLAIWLEDLPPSDHVQPEGIPSSDHVQQGDFVPKSYGECCGFTTSSVYYTITNGCFNPYLHTYIFSCSLRGFSATCLQQNQGSVVESLSRTAISDQFTMVFCLRH